ncbi:MAG: hypothetical protein QOJ95_486 [Mycobacterium sp.]|jgi:uncharacterized membrane protein|nr:hypothetical protein [Mycobacterium sp.]MDT5176288.1 hypothetical protein [Mycobacterium sp.]
MSHGDHYESKHHVKIKVRRDDERSVATAQMRWRQNDLVGTGEAELDPDDRYPKRVADELAVARALTHLTRQLFVTTAGDIQSVTGEEVSVR